jgi:hypothetical protein
MQIIVILPFHFVLIFSRLKILKLFVVILIGGIIVSRRRLLVVITRLIDDLIVWLLASVLGIVLVIALVLRVLILMGVLILKRVLVPILCRSLPLLVIRIRKSWGIGFFARWLICLK